MPRVQKINEAECRRLWLSGLGLRAIARRFDVDPSSIRRYAALRDWPAREPAPCGAPPTWDTELGYRLWHDLSVSLMQAAHRLRITPQTLRSYATYHGWRARRGAAEPKDVQPVLPPIDAIALYRAEKARKAKKEDAQLADARRLFLVLEASAKPKRGRPKKSAVQHSTDLEDAA